MTPLSPVLDHVVIDVRDRIQEAMHCFTALGFQLTPRGHHTLGSVNHLVIFETDYLELLGFGENGAARPELISFPIGFNGLVFKTTDADVVYRQAETVGLSVLPVQSFSRPVALDGSTRHARFRTARLDPAKVPMGRVYFCEQQTSELVWRPEWQSHPNGASGIARVVIVTPDPERSASLFRGLFGCDAVAIDGRRCVVAAGTARVELAKPDAVSAEFGDAAPEPAGRAEYMAALGIKILSLAGTTDRLRSVSGLRAETRRLVAPADAAFNTTIVFAE